LSKIPLSITENPERNGGGKMIIGLTGGIGTGKSTVSAMLKAKGIMVIDSDQIAREVVEPGSKALAQIVAHFGQEVLLPDGRLNRKALGVRVFGNEEERKRLMEITHPAIFAETEKRISEAKKNGEALIVLDSPLLIETGRYKQTDLVVLVYADEETQLQRIMSRDNLTEEEARYRINAQMPIDEKRQYADIIIDNRGTIEELEVQVAQLLNRLRLGEV
jgi:dephospho-CoA kinase